MAARAGRDSTTIRHDAPGAALEIKIPKATPEAQPKWAASLERMIAAKSAEKEKPPVKNVNQAIAFHSNITVNVHGDVKNPAQLAAEIKPYLVKSLADLQEQQRRAALHDEPHV